MKNGYYLFAYIEINRIANFYHIDTKRHDQNISLWKYTDGALELVRYWEIERLSRIKHHNKAFFSEEQALLFIDELLKEFDLTRDSIIEIVGLNSIDVCYKNEDYNYHSLCHLFSCLLMDSEKFSSSDVLAFSVDIDSDYIIENKSKHDYVGCYSKKGEISYFPIESPATLWSVASHDFKMGEGTLMAIASALKAELLTDFDISNESFFSNDYERIKTLYFTIKNHLKLCNEYNIDEYIRNYDSNFSFADNITSAVMKIVQKWSNQIMIRNIERAKDLFYFDSASTILAMSGGFALNCPTNSALMKKYSFKDFLAPPCVNDSGQSLGMALYYFYSRLNATPKFKLSSAFFGKKYEIEPALDKYRNYIVEISEFNPKTVVDDLSKNAVVWLDECSEIGPRALGHRSIISSPALLRYKNEINFIKKRQGWRPVAPVVLTNYASEWFKANESSDYMLRTFEILNDKKNLIPAVAHLDNSARIQTFDDRNDKLYKVIEEFKKSYGIPIICNTSLNDYKEPIIETPEQAIHFALKKKIEIAYLNGYRIKLNTELPVEDIRLKGQLDLWDYDDPIVPPLEKDEYEFYYWSNMDKDLSLSSEADIKMIKRMHKAFVKKNAQADWDPQKNFYY